jgi:hypothetical protein
MVSNIMDGTVFPLISLRAETSPRSPAYGKGAGLWQGRVTAANPGLGRIASAQ